jgi:NADH-quinone oxidoreductase subunit G
MAIADLSVLQRVLVVGSDLRKDHPLFAQRIRQATRSGGVVSVVNAESSDWALPVRNSCLVPAGQWVQALADIAAAIALENNVTAPHSGHASDAAKAIAASLLGGERKAVLLGNAAAHHSQASQLLVIANWIGAQTGATVGYLTEAANTVGAQLAGALPGNGGLNAGQMLTGGLKAAILLNNEPEFDSFVGATVETAMKPCEMVVTMSPFKANLSISDVLLPIAPFTETPGTFVNAEGRVQSFHAVVKPLGEARPGWKVFRALADILNLPGFDFDSAQEVLQHLHADNSVGVPGHVPADRLSNACASASTAQASPGAPCVASIYQLDSIVRRASALQLTADARTQGVREATA